jgi:hypothetical protein
MRTISSSKAGHGRSIRASPRGQSKLVTATRTWWCLRHIVPPPMSEARVYEAWETDGVKATHTRMQADGTRVTLGFSAHYDGNDYKYTSSPDYDIIALKRVDANTIEATLKKGGKVVQTTKDVVSSSSKSFSPCSSRCGRRGCLVVLHQ